MAPARRRPVNHRELTLWPALHPAVLGFSMTIGSEY